MTKRTTKGLKHTRLKKKRSSKTRKKVLTNLWKLKRKQRKVTSLADDRKLNAKSLWVWCKSSQKLIQTAESWPGAEMGVTRHLGGYGVSGVAAIRNPG